MRGRIVFVRAAVLATALVIAGCPNPSNDPGSTHGQGSSESLITSFVFKAADNPVFTSDLAGSISGSAISAAAPLFCPLSGLKPTVEVSPGATVIPQSGMAMDFRTQVVYMVTAEDGTTSSYLVTAGNGLVTTMAGQSWVTGHAEGSGKAATFYYPEAVTTDGTNLYVADIQNSTIRKIVIATGEVSTIAGTAGVTGYDAFPVAGTSARFYRPSGITYYANTLYVADTLNNNIRQMDLGTGMVSVVGLTVNFHSPKGITTDGTNLYIADTGAHRILKEAIGDPQVALIAGSGSAGHADGNAALATFNGPTALTTDGTNLYVADTLNHTIRKVVIATKDVTTLAGQALVTGAADGIGAAAAFYEPRGITLMGTSLYIADSSNFTLRKLELATNAVNTLVEPSGILCQPMGITNDGTNLYVADAGCMLEKVQ